MITRTQFPDTFLEDQLPALRVVTMGEYERYKDEYREVFNVEDSDRAIEQFTEITGFATMAEIAESEPVTYDDPLQAFDKTYVHRKFGRGYKVSQEMIDDDKFRIVKNLARELGISAKETVEIEAALVFDRAFNSSFLGPDGVSLCSTAHPRVGGGVQSNRPSTNRDLNIPAIEVALTQFSTWTDHRGKKIRCRPKKLVAGPALEWTMAEILAGPMRSDTANNTVNAFRHRAKESPFTDYMVYHYLNDPDAWFIIGDTSHPRYGLTLFWRKKFDTMSDRDFDTDSVKTAGRMRFSVGWHSWMGFYGSPGQ